MTPPLLSSPVGLHRCWPAAPVLCYTLVAVVLDSLSTVLASPMVTAPGEENRRPELLGAVDRPLRMGCGERITGPAEGHFRKRPHVLPPCAVKALA